MKLYHVTTSAPLCGGCLAHGSFSAPKRQEVVVGSASYLHLYRRAKGGGGALVSVCSAPMYATVRSVVAFRQPGLNLDYVAVTCDGGNVTLLAARAGARGFRVLAQQSHGRTGVRRTVCGQYLAADPHGRALLIAAVERTKLVYGIGRSDGDGDLPSLFSPLEAHRNACVFDAVALDVGYQNPRFAVLETPYDTGVKQLVHYELDLGLNTVLRRSAIDVHSDAHRLFPCPDAAVLLCRPGAVEYHPEEGKPVVVQIPRRASDNTARIVTCGAMIKVKKATPSWFYFLATELGDIHRVEVGDNGVVMAFFDTLPDVPTHMCILKPGFLFAACQGGDTHFLRFLRSEPEGDDGRSVSGSNDGAAIFKPHSNMRHLAQMASVGGAAQMRCLTVADYASVGTSQTLLAAGRGAAGVLHVRRPGMACEDRISPLALGAKARAVWSFELAAKRYIALGYDTHTAVLGVGDESLADATKEVRVRADVRTLYIGVMGSLLVQAHTRGVRTVAAGEVHEWKAGGGTRLVAAAANGAQCVAALSGGDVTYFELNDAGMLDAVEKVEDALGAAETPGDDLCVAIAQIRPGMRRASVFAVGDGAGARVLLYRVENKQVTRVAVHIAPAPVHSVALVDFAAADAPVHICTLFIGTTQGACVWLRVDYATGALSARRAVFLGSKPVHVTAAQLGPVRSCVFAAARPWICYPRAGTLRVSPIATQPFAACARFDADDGPGLLAVQGARLRMLALPTADAIAQCARLEDGAETPAVVVRNTETVVQTTKLAATPRRLVPLFSLPVGAGGMGEAPRLGATGVAPDVTGVQRGVAPPDERNGMELFVVVEADQRATLPVDGGATRASPGALGQWASVVRLVAVRKGDNPDDDGGGEEAVDTLDVARLGDDECALCAASTRTLGGAKEEADVAHVVVGVARRLRVNATGRKPKESTAPPNVQNELWTYRVDRRQRKLTLLHKTPLDNGAARVHAVTAFRDYMVVAMGARVRLYQLGRKQLLRKGECSTATTGRGAITALAASGGDRIFAADVAQSVVVLHYTHGTHGAPGTLAVVARDTVQRWLTCMAVVDYRTVAVGDKFGNIAVLRVPDEAEKEARCATLSAEACIHIGDMLTAVAFDGAAVRYATAHGALGALAPFDTESEHAVVRAAERWLQDNTDTAAAAEWKPLGRDHAAWRAAFYPVRNVVDGDLVEKIHRLTVEDRKSLEEKTARSTDDVLRILDALRWRVDAL